MTADWAITGGIIVLLLILSGFFSGTETALTASSRPRMHELARHGNRRARMVLALHERRERLIGAILLGNNLVNILASALATSLMLNLFGGAGVAYATIVMTLVVLVFGEVLPKTYALSHADRLALIVAPIMRPIVWLFAPVTHTLHLVIRGLLGIFGIRLGTELGENTTEEELRGAIALHAPSEEAAQHERQMLRSILDLTEVPVSDVMTHRRNVALIDADQSADAIVDQVLQSPYTRIPLYRGDVDDIVGVLHAKALLRAVRAHGGALTELDIAAMSSAPWFIPDSTDLLEQLLAFRERREHFAIVIDEYGAFMGIVTLEDILEEIVGEIADEHDVPVAGVRPQPDGRVVVEGSVTIRDLNREYDWSLPDENAATIAGLVLHEARLIPESGQAFVFHGFRFEILRRQRNQITLMRITPPRRPQQALTGAA